VIDIATRKVNIVGTTVNPTSAWMAYGENIETKPRI
jgi:hypothetical protein